MLVVFAGGAVVVGPAGSVVGVEEGAVDAGAAVDATLSVSGEPPQPASAIPATTTTENSRLVML